MAGILKGLVNDEHERGGEGRMTERERESEPGSGED